MESKVLSMRQKKNNNLRFLSILLCTEREIFASFRPSDDLDMLCSEPAEEIHSNQTKERTGLQMNLRLQFRLGSKRGYILVVFNLNLNHI